MLAADQHPAPETATSGLHHAVGVEAVTEVAHTTAHASSRQATAGAQAGEDNILVQHHQPIETLDLVRGHKVLVNKGVVAVDQSLLSLLRVHLADVASNQAAGNPAVEVEAGRMTAEAELIGLEQNSMQARCHALSPRHSADAAAATAKTAAEAGAKAVAAEAKTDATADAAEAEIGAAKAAAAGAGTEAEAGVVADRVLLLATVTEATSQ